MDGLTAPSVKAHTLQERCEAVHGRQKATGSATDRTGLRESNTLVCLTVFVYFRYYKELIFVSSNIKIYLCDILILNELWAEHKNKIVVFYLAMRAANCTVAEIAEKA
jgi:hypothetical protein